MRRMWRTPAERGDHRVVNSAPRPRIRSRPWCPKSLIANSTAEAEGTSRSTHRPSHATYWLVEVTILRRALWRRPETTEFPGRFPDYREVLDLPGPPVSVTDENALDSGAGAVQVVEFPEKAINVAAQSVLLTAQAGFPGQDQPRTREHGRRARGDDFVGSSHIKHFALVPGEEKGGDWPETDRHMMVGRLRSDRPRSNAAQIPGHDQDVDALRKQGVLHDFVSRPVVFDCSSSRAAASIENRSRAVSDTRVRLFLIAHAPPMLVAPVRVRPSLASRVLAQVDGRLYQNRKIITHPARLAVRVELPVC